MKKVSIADLKSRLSYFIDCVSRGETIEVLRRGVEVAWVTPLPGSLKNKTKLGCGKKSGQIVGDITEPLLPVDSWEMLKEE